jgi:two-component system, OmpR family, response regulator MprA
VTGARGQDRPGARATVLVVDDEDRVRNAILRALSLEEYEPVGAHNGEDALAKLAARAFDAVVLDWRMPDIDGVEICRRLRAAGDRMPVLMLTARDGIDERVVGLDAGADDYMVKPFALQEFLARLRALLRRSEPESGGRLLRFRDVALDQRTMDVRRGARKLHLTRTEYRLLELLLEHPGHVLSRSTIFEQVWGYDFGESSNSLGVYVGYLRRKLEEGGEARLVHTVRGVGYVLRDR